MNTDTRTLSTHNLPTGEFAIVETLDDALQVVWWGSHADYLADDREGWSDLATCSVVVDTYADALVELGI